MKLTSAGLHSAGWQTWLMIAVLAAVLGIAFGGVTESYVTFTNAPSGKGTKLMWIILTGLCAVAGAFGLEALGLLPTLAFGAYTTAIAAAAAWHWSVERYRSHEFAQTSLNETVLIAAIGITIGIVLRWAAVYIRDSYHSFMLA